MTPIFTSPALMFKPAEKWMCPNCLQIFKVCHVAKGVYVFRVIPKYRRGQVVFRGRQISLWHKSRSCLWLESPAMETGAVPSPTEFPDKPVPQQSRNGY